MKTLFPIILGLSLSGCVGQLSPKQTFELMDDSAVQRVAKIRIVNSTSVKSFVKIGESEGYSCKNKLWDPEPSQQFAIKQLKMAAANSGGTAISEPICNAEGTSLIANCWSSIVCKSLVYK